MISSGDTEVRQCGSSFYGTYAPLYGKELNFFEKPKEIQVAGVSRKVLEWLKMKLYWESGEGCFQSLIKILASILWAVTKKLSVK